MTCRRQWRCFTFTRTVQYELGSMRTEINNQQHIAGKVLNSAARDLADRTDFISRIYPLARDTQHQTDM